MANDTFDAWMAKLDQAFMARHGISVHDLPDMAYRDWYDDGITSAQAVGLVLEEAF